MNVVRFIALQTVDAAGCSWETRLMQEILLQPRPRSDHLTFNNNCDLRCHRLWLHSAQHAHAMLRLLSLRDRLQTAESRAHQGDASV